VGTHISIDLRPGASFTWSRIGAHLKPGTYQVVCSYHAYLGMVGLFTVAPAKPG
jgi:plastocyanin